MSILVGTYDNDEEEADIADSAVGLPNGANVIEFLSAIEKAAICSACDIDDVMVCISWFIDRSDTGAGACSPPRLTPSLDSRAKVASSGPVYRNGFFGAPIDPWGIAPAIV